LIMEISKAELASAAAVTRRPAHPGTQRPSRTCAAPKSSSRHFRPKNVKYVWGYPGGAVLHIYDAFYKQDTIQHVLVRHEQAAVHAADGYARATGDVGVALVTSGPGVTNAVTGIATAYMDSIPMVIITGQVPDGRHRPGRLPGMRHGRHHAAHRQAQLPGQGCRATWPRS
jgi:acetolactate synthase-1/2/3 large subunit